MPLAGLFSRTLERYADDMQRPRFFRELFASLVEHRGSDPFDWFTAELDIFLRALAGELDPFRLRLAAWDTIDTESFEQYRTSRRMFEATTVAMVENGDGIQVAIQVGAPSPDIASRVPTDELLPSVRFAIRNPHAS